MKEYMIFLKCSKCKAVLNSTDAIDYETALKLHQDALINPLIGWCKKCDLKPHPILTKIINLGVMKGTIGKFIGVEIIETDKGILLNCNGKKEIKKNVMDLLKNIELKSRRG